MSKSYLGAWAQPWLPALVSPFSKGLNVTCKTEVNKYRCHFSRSWSCSVYLLFFCTYAPDIWNQCSLCEGPSYSQCQEYQKIKPGLQKGLFEGVGMCVTMENLNLHTLPAPSKLTSAAAGDEAAGCRIYLFFWPTSHLTVITWNQCSSI